MKKWLFLIAVTLASALVLKKTCSGKKSEWQGLSESEVRSKLDAKLPNRISDEKRSAISDKVVDTMRSKGVITDDEQDIEESSALIEDESMMVEDESAEVEEPVSVPS